MSKELSSTAEIVINTLKFERDLITTADDFREAIWNGNEPPKTWKISLYYAISQARTYLEENEDLTIRNWPKQGWKLVHNEYEKLTVCQQWRKRAESYAKGAYRKARIVNRDMLPKKPQSAFDKTLMLLANTVNIIKGIQGPLDNNIALVQDLEAKEQEEKAERKEK